MRRGGPQTAGCVSDGETCSEALANVEDATRARAEAARELGRPVPEPKGRHQLRSP